MGECAFKLIVALAAPLVLIPHGDPLRGQEGACQTGKLRDSCATTNHKRGFKTLTRLRNLLAMIAFLCLVSGLMAQSSSSDSQTLSDHPAAPVSPQPGTDGVFTPGQGVQPPVLVHPEAAAYPRTKSVESGDVLLSTVIDSQGHSSDVMVVRSIGSTIEQAVIEAVLHCQFNPGTVNGLPEPVRIFLRVHFSPDRRPAYPRIVAAGIPSDTHGDLASEGGYTPPVPLARPKLKYPKEARKAHSGGMVLLSFMIDSEGRTDEIQVVKSAGMGFDESAIEAVKQYRFRPATRNGVPVSQQVTIEVNFEICQNLCG